jgi:hypothetical protein
MRHARPSALDQLEDLIAALRAVDGLTEKSRGVFHRRGRAFLHFHEDADSFFADIRGEEAFDRYEVKTAAARTQFLTEVRRRANS